MRRDAELAWVWDDGDSILTRGRSAARDQPIWSVTCKRTASRGAALRLERVFEQRHLFEGAWALLPLAIEECDGRKQLLFSDPGGELLARSLGIARDLRAKLTIAIGATVALRGMHERELIHGDLRPASMVFDAASGRVWLRGTGYCQRVAQRQEAPAPEGGHGGTLRYVSPEQTGRLNRPLDMRSDLYSLGVTLYELFAGKHPFVADEQLEWAHCHVARQPPPLHELAAWVPTALSAVVHKLLAKAPEDRYQTAAGLEADLRHCAHQLAYLGEVPAFALATHDVTPELRAPQRLHGRDRELAALLGAYAAVQATGCTEIVCIAGAPGVGKSSLVDALQKSRIAAGGLCAFGKVDQLKRDIPYATLATACRMLVRTVLGRREDEIARLRAELKRTLGAHGQLLVQLVPELVHLIGLQPDVEALPFELARGRFQQLFLRFIAVFGVREHPLTLFLDDVQWLDAATLELLPALLASRGQHLLLVFAYRDDELRAPHPFLGSLDALRAQAARLTEVRLQGLAPDDVASLVADVLRVSDDEVRSLARVVHDKTAGNPFFVQQFLAKLAEDGSLEFDQARGWAWDLACIDGQASTENVVAMMVMQFDRLPRATQRVLQHFACVGREATAARLAAVCGVDVAEVASALREVVRNRLVSITDAGYAFCHDRVQEASYALLSESERAAMHLAIGRSYLAAGCADGDLSFETVHQFDRAGDLLCDARERVDVAALYRDAGLRAQRAMAHGSARGYFARGRALLGDDAWSVHYSLCLALELGHAESEFLAGDPLAATQLLAALAPHARSHRDRAAVTRLQIVSHSALDQQLEAVEVCLRFLRGVGIDWTPHPSRECVQREFEELRRQLGARSVESLIDLPPMIDDDRRATMAALTAMLPVAIFVDEHLNSLALCCMVNMSLAHGNSDGSCFAYVMLGRVAGPYFGDPELGFRFGRLAYDLIEKPGMGTFRARVASVFGICVYPWTHDLPTAVPLARRATAVALETGDLTFAAYGWPCLVSLLLASGHDLAEVEAEARVGLDFARRTMFGQIADMLVAQLQLIRALRGHTPQLGSFDEDDFDERAFEQHFADNPVLGMAACWYWIRKLQGRTLAGNFAAARAAREQAGRLLWTSGSFFDTVEYEFYGGLALAAELDAAREPALARELDAHARRLDGWAQHCPRNFEAMALLVRAECARVNGGELEAMRLYERAAESARRAGFTHHEAIAHELASRFCRERALDTSAQSHLVAAHAAYRRWGAEGKCRALAPEAGLTSNLAPAAADGDAVDLATVVRTSQAVSRQVGHEQVVRSLVAVAVEHAGAQRGLLLMRSGDAMQLRATASTAESLRVELVDGTPDDAMPTALLRYVQRTQETVLLDDATEPHPFSSDPYFAQTSARSLLCLPIQKQSLLVGVLYLENNLAPRVFTPARVEVLKLLASQAAISLENAQLGEKEALLKEVHHRVKNNLQLVSSLLNLQAARAPDPDVANLFADCRQRVRAMALVHENLYRVGNLSHIPMDEHVRTLCARLGRAHGAGARSIALRVTVAALQFDMRRAIVCGLIINELVSNALKHAFPGGRGGCVEVTLRSRADGMLELSVTDDGVGMHTMPAAESSETLGLQLVRDFARQLDGEVSASQDVGSTRFLVAFPAAQATRFNTSPPPREVSSMPRGEP